MIPDDIAAGILASLGEASAGAADSSTPPLYSDTVSVSIFGQILSDIAPEAWKPGARYAQLFIENNVRTGYQEVDLMSNALAATLGQVANTIPQEVGSGYGVAVHWAFAMALRLLHLPRVEVEQSFDREGVFAKYGAEGSVRTDVLLRSQGGKIVAVWDVKTNKAYLSRRRVLQIREWLRIDDGVPIIELHVQRGKAILR